MTTGFRRELAARYVRRLTRLHTDDPPGDAELVKNLGIYDRVASILRDWCLAPNTSRPPNILADFHHSPILRRLQLSLREETVKR